MATLKQIKAWILNYASQVTPEVRDKMISDTRHMDHAAQWKEELESMELVARWLGGTQIPATVRSRIISWIRNNPETWYRNIFETLAVALSRNDPKMMVEETLEMDV